VPRRSPSSAYLIDVSFLSPQMIDTRGQGKS
jgi:hypothetical protein